MAQKPNLTSQHIVRLLADENRLKVVAALVLADTPLLPDGLCEATGLKLRAVVDAVDRLVSGGLVIQFTDPPMCVLAGRSFQYAARAEAPDAPPSDYEDEPDDVARVLDLAFTNGKLVQWPSKRSKRLVVLDHLAQNFDIGKRYKESEVNEVLRAYGDDVATMRRYLVDDQFLDRDTGEYWRCGGSF